MGHGKHFEYYKIEKDLIEAVFLSRMSSNKDRISALCAGVSEWLYAEEMLMNAWKKRIELFPVLFMNMNKISYRPQQWYRIKIPIFGIYCRYERQMEPNRLRMDLWRKLWIPRVIAPFTVTRWAMGKRKKLVLETDPVSLNHEEAAKNTARERRFQKAVTKISSLFRYVRVLLGRRATPGRITGPETTRYRLKTLWHGHVLSILFSISAMVEGREAFPCP